MKNAKIRKIRKLPLLLPREILSRKTHLPQQAPIFRLWRMVLDLCSGVKQLSTTLLVLQESSLQKSLRKRRKDPVCRLKSTLP